MKVVTIETPSLGDRSYLVVADGVAAVIDPQRDIDRILREADALGVEIAHVFETHVHNDYVTGGLHLAREAGASYHLNVDDEVRFDRSAVRDGDTVELGDLTIRVVHTPGHTHTHLAYVVEDGDRALGVFTGGSLLFGSVGRTDLVGPEHTLGLTRDQYRSVHRLAERLGDDVAVYPTHGFGSFCSSGDIVERSTSTVGVERTSNDAFRAPDEDAFVTRLLAGLDAFPRYYAHMAPRNLAGPSSVDLRPVEPLEPSEVLRRIRAGEWVVDLRDRRRFADTHVAGSINLELADSASTHLGWLIPWGTPVTLVADSEDDVAQMQRQLVRIGIDRPAGRVAADDLLEAGEQRDYPVVDFAELKKRREAGDELFVLDARRDGETAAGHLPGAKLVPLHELSERLDEIPDDEDVWVHCASGYRASIAASLLARSGRRPVLVDGDFDEHARPIFDLVTTD